MRDLSNDIVIHKSKNGFEYLQFKVLLDYGINHAYTLKPHFFNTRPGVVSKETYEKSVQNYKDFCEALGIDHNKLVKPNQTHTNRVEIVDFVPKNMSIEEDRFENVDGLITNLKGVSLASVNADCILLLMYDPVKNVIANVHSGWRGTFGKIAVNCLNKMVESFGCRPQDIIVCICPCIRKCHFEVKDDVKNLCEEIFGYSNKMDDFVQYIEKDESGDDKWVIDTVAITKFLLEDCGVRSCNIYDCGICSFCNKDVVNSCRGDGKSYGLGTAIMQLGMRP